MSGFYRRLPMLAAKKARSLPREPDRKSTLELSQLEARLEDLTNRYNMALGEIRAIGDPVVLGSEKHR